MIRLSNILPAPEHRVNALGVMLLGLALGLPAAGALLGAKPAAAQSVTVTTGRGGSLSHDRSCDRNDAGANCQTSTTATNAAGDTASRNRQRVTGNGESTTSVTATGPAGESRSRERKVQVSR